MNKHLILITSALLTLPLLTFAAESPIVRELDMLNEQRSKAAATALAPINQKYKAALEQMLKRATQAKDADAIASINEALAALETPAPARSTKISARALGRKLEGKTWIGDGKHYFGEFQFQKDGNVMWIKTGSPGVKSLVPYEIKEDGTVEINVSGQKHIMTFTPDQSAFTIGESTFKPK